MAENECIQKFYARRSVFITGATGFVGKALIEKLLRCCPQIETLYLLIRPSKDKDAHSRLQELLKCEVFEWLRKNQKDALNKLVPINGDVSLPNLGISPLDMQQIEENVSVVFNSAARVKFDEDLRSALDANVKGPKTVTTFCRRLQHLKVFLHVSTTYNNLDKKEIEEKVYETPLDPQKLLDLVDSMDDDLLACITKQLLGKCPNVYSYSKALGENLLKNECEAHGIPLVIVRPSIVSAAINEPLPGWVDNMNGATGVIVGVWKGIIRTLNSNCEHVFDLIPIDIPINLIVAAAWEAAIDSKSTQSAIKVYNCSTGSLNPLKWRDFREWCLNAMVKSPCKAMMWYPSVNLRTNNFIFKLEIALYHHLPGYTIDALSVLRGRKPFLTRLYQKVHRALSCVGFYMNHEWHFVTRNSILLMDKMSAEDKDTFNFDVRRIHWESYLENYMSGIRTCILREDSSTLPAAIDNLKKMKILRMTMRIFITGLLVFMFYATFVTYWHMVSSNFRSAGNISPVNQFNITDFDLMSEVIHYLK